MEITKSKSINFYRNLGKLFYSIAAADGVVRDAEYTKLKAMVEGEWLGVDHIEDSFGTDTAYQIEIVFDWLFNEEFDADICFKQFMSFKNEHEYLFNEKINKLILKTAGTIAAAFSGVNKSELRMLAKLSIELKKTK
jgi:hypothetical protein